MIGFVHKYAVQLALGGTLALAAMSGAFVATGFSAGSQQTPQRTVTVNVGQGVTGPQGPKGEPGATGPAGPAGGGAESCPTGSTFGKIVVNSPGGHVSFLTCLVDE